MTPSTTLPDLAWAVALASLPGVGPGALRTLLGERPASAVFAELLAGEVPPALLKRLPRLSGAARRHDVAASWRALESAGIEVTRLGEPGYPARLAADPEAPALLFSLGNLPRPEIPAVALVGTRSCTHYGEEVAAALGTSLAGAGVVVVSGLAAGIDHAAHAGALSVPNGAAPLGLVGGGVDVIYPSGARSLWQAVVRRGAIVSEAPPGAAPESWRFPQRNRLIAAMSDLVVVVESHRSGGSLHTVEAAARRGMAVGAVPGSVRSLASAGCNDLLADGAHVIRDIDDVLAVLGLCRASATTAGAAPSRAAADPSEVRRASEPRQLGALGALDERVLRALEHRPVSAGTVVERSGASLGECAETLERLAGLGLARRCGAGWELVP